MGVGAARTWLPPVLVAVAVLALVNLPRLVLLMLTPPQHTFLGPVWGHWDAQVYWETIGDGAAGWWLWPDRFDGSPHRPYLIYPPYLLAGHLFPWLSPPAVYEVLRWVCEPLALGAAWIYVRSSLPGRFQLFGYCLALFAGGLGWVFVSRPQTALGPVVPVDLTGPDFNVLNSFQMAPHLALSVAGLGLYGWGLIEAVGGRRRGLVGAAGLGLVASYHEFVTPMAIMVGAVFIAWRGRNRLGLAMLLLSAAAVAPFDLYLLYLKLFDPLASKWVTGGSWEIQNLPSFLAGRALLLPFAVLGGWRAFRLGEPGAALALCWVTLAQAFNALPQLEASALHRSLEGAGLAWGVLACYGMMELSRRVRAYVLMLACVTPILQLPSVVIYGRADPGVYPRQDAVQAVAWARQVGLSGRVLGSPDGSRFAIALSGLSNDVAGVPSGGPWLTDGLVAQPPAARSGWLRARGDTVVVWGAAEQSRYGSGPLPGLAILHREGEVYLLGPAG